MKRYEIEEPELVPDPPAFSEQPIDLAGGLGIRQQCLLRNRDDTGMLRGIERPRPPPNGPGLTERAEVLAVVGDEHATAFGGGEELLAVDRGGPTKCLGREYLVPTLDEQKAEGRRHVRVEVEIGHAG